MHPGERELHEKKAYRKNREEGKRGQGEYIETQQLVRPSNITIVGTKNKKGQVQRFAMNREERRRIKLDINRLEERDGTTN